MSFTIFVIFAVLLINTLTKCEQNPSIVIIGAGPSGVAAATRLLKHNFTNLKILEAEPRIGGRINSVKFGDAYLDLGAEWCHGEKDNVVYSLVKDLNILKHTDQDFQFVFSNGKYIDEKLKNEFFQFASSLEGSHVEGEFANNCRDVRSVGECFMKNFNSRLFQKHQNSLEDSEIVQGSFEWLWSYISSYDSPLDLNDLVLKSKYKICEGDLRLNWNGLGYKTILEVMMQKFPNASQALPIDDKIILSKEVTNITNWNHTNKTIITTKDGSTFAADIVILTPSVGVLKANHQSLFQPQLPDEKVEAIESIGFGAIAKAALHFPQRWWDNDISWVPIWSREEKLKVVREFSGSVTPSGAQWLNNLFQILPADNNPKVLIAWFAGNAVPDIEKLSDDTLRDGIMLVIRKFLSQHYNVTEPDNMIRKLIGHLKAKPRPAASKILKNSMEKKWHISFLFSNGHQWLNHLIRIAPASKNPHVLTAWFAGKAVPDIEKLSDGAFRDGVMFVVQKFLGQHYNVTGPDSLIRSSWYLNPHFRGTYSYESVQGHHEHGRSLQSTLESPIENENGKPSLLFAGEATHPHFFSTVHGAIETGYREADRIIELYRN